MKKLVNKYFLKNVFLLLALTAILIARDFQTYAHPMFWAEDGTIFFRESLLFGLKSLIMPYAGYLFTFHRLAALLVVNLPYSIIPAVYVYINLGFILLVGAKILSSRFDVPYKALFLLSIVLIPTAGEIFDFDAIQWILSLTLLILLVQKQPRSLLETAGDCLFLTISGLTGVFILLAFPLYVFKYFKKRNRYNLVLLVIAFVCSLLQLYFLTTTAKVIADKSIIAAAISNPKGVWYLIHFFSAINLGAALSSIFVITLPFWMFWLIKPSEEYYAPFFVFLWYFIANIFSGIFRHYMSVQDAFGTNCYFLGDRFKYLPVLMTVWMLILVLGGKGKVRKTIAVVLLIAVFIFAFVGKPSPAWQYSFNFYNRTHNDYKWGYYSKLIVPGKSINIPVNPCHPCDLSSPEGDWIIRLPAGW